MNTDQMDRLSLVEAVRNYEQVTLSMQSRLDQLANEKEDLMKLVEQLQQQISLIAAEFESTRQELSEKVTCLKSLDSQISDFKEQCEVLQGEKVEALKEAEFLILQFYSNRLFGRGGG